MKFAAYQSGYSATREQARFTSKADIEATQIDVRCLSNGIWVFRPTMATVQRKLCSLQSFS